MQFYSLNGKLVETSSNESLSSLRILNSAFEQCKVDQNLASNEAFMRSALQLFLDSGANWSVPGAAIASHKVSPVENDFRNSNVYLKFKFFNEELTNIDAQQSKAVQSIYPACCVYVVFELEHSKRLCLQSLEVPDVVANGCVSAHSVKSSSKFRNEVLDVLEPTEPNNILWANVEITPLDRRIRQFASILLSGGVLVASYFIVQSVGGSSSSNQAIVIGLVSDTKL